MQRGSHNTHAGGHSDGGQIGGPPLWLAILCVGLIVGVMTGRAQSMGLYLPHVTTAIGVGREDFGFALALTFLLMGIGAPFSGALIDKYGAGPVVIVCCLFTAAGLYCMYAATSSLWLMASGILMGIGVSGTGVTSLVGVIGRIAPPEKRLSAIASVAMSAGIGTFIALPTMHILIEWLGWQKSLLVLTFLVVALIPAVLPIARRRTMTGRNAIREQTLREALHEAVRYPSYWLLISGFFVCGFHVSFIVVHLPAFTVDRGLPTWVGPVALTVVGLANIVGTWIAGQSSRFIEKRRGLSLIYAARALIFVGFLYVPTTPNTVIALSGLLGFIWLATIPLTSGLVATFFGTTWMSMLFGIVFLSHQLGSFLGSWLAGRLFDMTGSYDTMWKISIALGLISALIHWPIREAPVSRPINPVPAE